MKSNTAEQKRLERQLPISDHDELRIPFSKLLLIQEEEKRNIAMMLCGGVGESLAAIKSMVEDSLQQAEKSDGKSVVRSLQDVVPMIQGAIEEVRKATMDLRPTILDNLGIVATISVRCSDFKNTYPNIQIKKNVAIKEEEIPDPLKLTIYRILQEAFNNIAKHSQADLVVVSLKKKKKTIELTIEDNGHGFDKEDELAAGILWRGSGLACISERTKISGGTFAIQSTRGEGTLLRASWVMRKT